MDKTKRRPILAGNWKMNGKAADGAALVKELAHLIGQPSGADVVVCPPFTSLAAVGEALQGTGLQLGAQNCHFEAQGAFTGEISADMLIEAGCSYVIVGHSERRQYFAETDATVNARLRAALAAGLRPILCVGESLAQRELSVTAEWVALQVKSALAGVLPGEISRVVIAYEPIWAIGTGRTATAQQAQEVCAVIRNTLAALYGEEAAQGQQIQYGGSMNAKNAAELLAQKDIDGGLIGGASLKAADFAAIVRAAAGDLCL